MTKREKRLQKIRQNPKHVTKEQLDVVLNDFGFKLRKGKGSHTVYEHSTEDISLVVAAHKTHIPVYIVKKALEAIDQIIKQGVSEEIENNEEND